MDATSRGPLRKAAVRNGTGFTLIEIIAVLLILGILGAVAVPKYVNMQVQAKNSAALGQLSALKGTLNKAYVKAFLFKGSQPTGAEVITNAGFVNNTNTTVGTAPDIWGVRLSASGNNITVNVLNRGGDANYNTNSFWNTPT